MCSPRVQHCTSYINLLSNGSGKINVLVNKPHSCTGPHGKLDIPTQTRKQNACEYD